MRGFEEFILYPFAI